MDKYCRICHNTSCSNHGKNMSFLGDGWKCNYIPVPTNADSIRAMADEELAEFLSSIAYDRETPWSEPFDEKFCKSCPTTMCTVEGYHHPMDLHECDFTDGKCPHGEDIVWWLRQPCGEEDKHEAD